jgi:hypothetical protein
MSVFKDVDNLLDKSIKKNQKDIDNATIKPFSEDYPFSTNGIYLYCGKMGSGKTYTILKHLMIMDKLYGEPYYDEIIFSSTSGQLDKTVESIKDEIQTPINFIKDTELMSYLEKRIKDKMKYYAITKFLDTDGKVKNEIMEKIIEKHGLKKMVDGKWEPDMKQIGVYLIDKLDKWGFKRYPVYDCIVLDDFAGHPLLKKPDSPLNKMLTKTRHYHITCILGIQTWRFVHLNFKRLCTDILIWKGFSMEDFEAMIKQTPNQENWKVLWEQYSQFQNPHDYVAIHITAGKIDFINSN